MVPVNDWYSPMSLMCWMLWMHIIRKWIFHKCSTKGAGSINDVLYFVSAMKGLPLRAFLGMCQYQRSPRAASSLSEKFSAQQLVQTVPKKLTSSTETLQIPSNLFSIYFDILKVEFRKSIVSWQIARWCWQTMVSLSRKGMFRRCTNSIYFLKYINIKVHKMSLSLYCSSKYCRSLSNMKLN